MTSLAPQTLSGALAPDGFQFLLDLVDTFQNAPAVRLELSFAFTPHPNAALLARKMAPIARQPRQQMLQLRQFDLKLPFTGPGALRENVQDQRRAIEHFALEYLFKVATLCRRQFIVEDDGVNFFALAVISKFPRFAGTDESSRHGGLEFLGSVADDLASGRNGQFSQFFERSFDFPAMARLQFDANEKDSFGPLGRC